MSLRRQIRMLFGIALIVVASGVVFGALTFHRLLDARAVLLDRADVAQVDSQKLLAALVDQEVGVRGFVITSDESFLDPYNNGVASETAVASSLATDLADLPNARSAFAATRLSAAAWQDDYVAPTLAAVRSGNSAPRTDAVLARGKSLFDALRATFTDLNIRLASDRAAARHRLDVATYQLAVVLSILGLMALIGTAVVWQIFRNSVRAPLAALAVDARRVSGGDLDHHVAEFGPEEFRMLAADIESMRQRIVDDLRAVSEGRAELEVQGQVLSRSNAELEQFAYVASHDLQEPLRKVTSFCQLLQSRYSGQLDEKADQYIEFAVDGAKRMQALINDLLAFSRVGRRSGPMVEVDCNEVFDQAVDNLGGRIDDAGATVTTAMLPTVRGEKTLLVALFQNLIGNAVKFARPDVPPRVSIDATPTADAWLFTVADNGIGIEAQYADRVFTIFQRLHPKDAYEGTGIGLSLCRKIVEDHGGRIWIEVPATASSEVALESAGPGTIIHFTLPVVTLPVVTLPIIAVTPPHVPSPEVTA